MSQFTHSQQALEQIANENARPERLLRNASIGTLISGTAATTAGTIFPQEYENITITGAKIFGTAVMALISYRAFIPTIIALGRMYSTITREPRLQMLYNGPNMYAAPWEPSTTVKHYDPHTEYPETQFIFGNGFQVTKSRIYTNPRNLNERCAYLDGHLEGNDITLYFEDGSSIVPGKAKEIARSPIWFCASPDRNCYSLHLQGPAIKTQ
ncbi:MAG: hypothetical protein ACMXYE_02875 [Candidatus Woesearchaeota archaeon]